LVAAVFGALLLGCALGHAATSTPSRAEDQESDAALTAARTALANQEWAEAELLLERALMLRTNSAEALLELAQLLARRGRIDEAMAMIRALAGDPRTPEAQRASLNQVLADLRRHQGTTFDAAVASSANPGRPAPAVASAPNTAPNPANTATFGISSLRWRAEALAGHSSNPLVATSASSITLTLPDGNFQLPLETRPQAGSYAGLTLAALTSGGADLVYQAQQVDVSGPQAAHRLSASMPISLPVVGRIATVARVQQFGDYSRRYQIGLQSSPLELRGAIPAGAIYVGMYREPERVRRGFEWRWEWTLPTSTSRLRAGLWADGDTNSDVGAPPQAGLGGRASMQLGAHIHVHAQVHLQRDTRGYNPLLDNNSRRVFLNRHLATDFLIPGPTARSWLVRIYDTGRSSNLPLFAWRDYGVQLIWRKAW
jgi:Tfp pilus assembly protein PilF